MKDRVKRGWTKSEAAEGLEITPRTIHFYTDEGLVTPEIANPKGKGTTRKYSRMNLLTILIIKELAQFGINLSRIKEATESLNRGLLNHPGWWDPHGEGSLLPKNPQPGDVIIPQDPAKLRYYLVGYDLHTDRGLFGYVIINEDEPLPLYMRERIMARHNTAVVVDVTSALEKVKKLL